MSCNISYIRSCWKNRHGGGGGGGCPFLQCCRHWKLLSPGCGSRAATTAATWARARVYRSDLLLWGDAASKAREHVRPHMMYAVFLHRGNRDDDARRVLERARAIDPDDPQVRAALSDLANHEEAR